jgi:hypothetical protein
LAVALIAAVLLSPVLYVLASGPAAWLVIYDRMSFETYSAIYGPLVAAEGRSETVWRASRWYRNLFIPRYCWGGDDDVVQCGS